uniref:Uncharacterized protein n=1 Tax=viral metagenome TaxID=1070528 RepID=A0A6M3M8Q0_9ZZZZ
MKEGKVILDKSILKEVRHLHDIEESHRESIQRLSEAAGDAKRKLWALVHEAHPSLKGKIASIDVSMGEITILDSEEPKKN